MHSRTLNLKAALYLVLVCAAMGYVTLEYVSLLGGGAARASHVSVTDKRETPRPVEPIAEKYVPPLPITFPIY